MLKTSEARNIGGGSTRKTIEKFNQAQQQMEERLQSNPFSETYVKKEFNKEAKDYARPPPGSKTEARAKKAGDYVTREIIFLCETISRNAVGEPPNCLVGMLIRARKYGLVEFEGEMLYQGQDNHKIVRLLKTMDEIRQMVQFSGDPVHCIAIKK